MHPPNPDKNQLLAVLQVLKKYNLKGTEELLKKEANIDESVESQDSDVSSVLTGYKSDGDPEKYEDCYMELKRFIESSLDIYKHELGMILYPVLVHMYLELVYNGHTEKAINLMKRYGPEQDCYYQDDLKKLALVTKRDHMSGNELTDTFKSNQFIIRMSRDTLSLLKRHLHDKKASVLMNIVQEHLYFDMYEGVARNKIQINATSGAVIGEATRQDNKTKVYYGLPKAPDIQSLAAPVEDEDDGLDADAPDKPKKKKPKKDPLFSKKTKSDPNAPPVDRIPIPDLKDNDKLEKVKALREASKRVNLNPETSPSICCYTLLNANHTVTCADITEDSSMLAVGFSDSLVKVWTLVPQKLRALKTANQLNDINIDAEDVLVRMMDERSGETSRSLFGHSGNVYSVSFAPDRTLLLSCSEDTTIRLWSLQIWTCLVVYKGHMFPVWDVKFSPLGYYFASASNDRTARLWATDHYQPLRMFAGHFSDVDCIQFHPNSNYVATGSSDRRVCLWDCTNGNHVRLMTGHKSPIHALAFSICGRFLSSAGSDCKILVWDLAHGHLVAELNGHNKPIHTLTFSRCGNILVSGSLDCTVKMWDFSKLADDSSSEDVNISHNPEVKMGDNYLLWNYGTKNSPLIHLHFTRRNLLLAIGMFDGISQTST
ncbi:PREDICTED: transcription initiation factor TFIID subunit 5 [Nicrophorus vespilloides]|uniref:Transcription initiation factor TFIID subunit 5 n=1 Tax=Nicrophorus vespilloides TaxID=110193 RepID=A0ABM1NCS5_NICVS|nr:PREDICTED: transcription initiation factor TFIID subunit 5 [Nicrophorus vespilloides]